MSKTPSRINVEVTEADIERAHKNDSYKCVVAQAVARTVPLATNIEVDTQTVRFTIPNEGGRERRVYLTPYAVQGYVIAFDAGDPIEPFSFQLRDPKRVARHVRTDTGREAEREYDVKVRGRKRSQSSRRKDPSGGIVEESPTVAYDEAKRRSDKGGPEAPPRVFKKRRRAYGHRLLRINQEPKE